MDKAKLSRTLSTSSTREGEMDTAGTRYEEIGRLYDLSLQNTVIVVFLVTCSALTVGAFVLAAVCPRRDEVSRSVWLRRKLLPPAICLSVMGLFIVFLGFGFYRQVLPDPQTTDQMIMAQSADTAVNDYLGGRFGPTVRLDSGASIAHSSADMRSAAPRRYDVRFRVGDGNRTMTCEGFVDIGSAVSTVPRDAWIDPLNERTGRGTGLFAPVTTRAHCVGAVDDFADDLSPAGGPVLRDQGGHVHP